jgi:hypothetical protein
MKIIPTLKRINVMYFTHKDHKGNVFVIDNTNLTVVSQTHSTVVTTDFTIVSQFDCKAKTKTELIKEDYVDCVFATHGPHIYRVQLKEDPATGLVEVTNSPLKGKYELFFDDIPTKLIFNDNFLALLSLSVSGGKQRVLVYKFTDKNGSKYLWSGIKLKDHTKRLLNELDFAILPNNNLIFTTNSFVSSNVFSLSKSVALKEAEIQVNDADLDVLKQYKIKFNADQIDIEQAFVPLSNFFLHSDEQSSSILMTSDKWYHWVILSGLALLLYGYLFYRWKLEKDRRQKLREEVLCNNLGDEIRV